MADRKLFSGYPLIFGIFANVFLYVKQKPQEIKPTLKLNVTEKYILHETFSQFLLLPSPKIFITNKKRMI